MKQVFISGPLGAEADWPANVREACRLAEIVSELGFAVVVPHCFVEWHRHYPAEYERWIERDLRLVECSDLVLRLPGESPGADLECEYAIDMSWQERPPVVERLPEDWGDLDVARALFTHFKVGT